MAHISAQNVQRFITTQNFKTSQYGFFFRRYHDRFLPHPSPPIAIPNLFGIGCWNMKTDYAYSPLQDHCTHSVLRTDIKTNTST